MLHMQQAWKAGDTAHFFFGYYESSAYGNLPQTEGEIRIDGNLRIISIDPQSITLNLRYGNPQIVDALSPLAQNRMSRIWLSLKKNLDVTLRWDRTSHMVSVVDTSALLAAMKFRLSEMKPDSTLPGIPPFSYVSSRIGNEKFVSDQLFKEINLYFDAYQDSLPLDTFYPPKMRGLCLLGYPEPMATVIFTKYDSAAKAYRIAMRKQLVEPERSRLIDSLKKLSGDSTASVNDTHFFVNTDFGYDPKTSRITGLLHEEGFTLEQGKNRTVHHYFFTLNH